MLYLKQDFDLHPACAVPRSSRPVWTSTTNPRHAALRGALEVGAMSGAVTPLAPRPFSQRVLTALPIEPAFAGAAVSLALVVFYLVVESALGTVRRVLDGELDSIALRATAIPLVLIAYIPAAPIYLARWTRRHVEALAPLLRGEPMMLRAERACGGPARLTIFSRRS